MTQGLTSCPAPAACLCWDQGALALPPSPAWKRLTVAFRAAGLPVQPHTPAPHARASRLRQHPRLACSPSLPLLLSAGLPVFLLLPRAQLSPLLCDLLTRSLLLGDPVRTEPLSPLLPGFPLFHFLLVTLVIVSCLSPCLKGPGACGLAYSWHSVCLSLISRCFLFAVYSRRLGSVWLVQ